jgi:hypothetical protein
MRQFQNPDLFNNDLLTDYAKASQPWGFIAIYYLLSFLADPIWVSKLLPCILLCVVSLYLYKLVKYFAGNFAGLTASILFITSPIWVNSMAGGHARSFAYPLIIVFLYYLVRKDYAKSAFVVVLQGLFYPTSLLIGATIYLLSFLCLEGIRPYLDSSRKKRNAFICAILISSSLLAVKTIMVDRKHIGTLVTRSQMTGHPEYYADGRYPVLPIPPLSRQLIKNIYAGPTYLEQYVTRLNSRLPFDFKTAIYIIMALWLGFEYMRKKIIIPKEIVFLFVSGIILFVFADLFLLKLFLPTRCLTYSIPLVSFIMSALFISSMVAKIGRARIQIMLKAIIIFLLLLGISRNVSAGLINEMGNRKFYAYLRTLPQNSLIAAPPYLADNIPLFAQRKVFINDELSHPFFDKYWQVIKKRTYDFFNAYYAEDAISTYDFCLKNGIDYLIIDASHFSEAYLKNRHVYFEPFNQYALDIAASRKRFVLKNIVDSDKLFADGTIFVINKEVLLHY